MSGLNIDMPQRIQRKRTKGWKMPENTVDVTRSGRWGNPFIINPNVKAGSKHGACYIAVPTGMDAVECFAEMMRLTPEFIDEAIAELRGKNLACWCRVGEPCHGDVLLEIANSAVSEV